MEITRRGFLVITSAAVGAACGQTQDGTRPDVADGATTADDVDALLATLLAALQTAARTRNAGKTCYATDGHPLAFEPFMDAFAHRVGRPRPLHLPLRLRTATGTVGLQIIHGQDSSAWH
jgi:hypothetical protein